MVAPMAAPMMFPQMQNVDAGISAFGGAAPSFANAPLAWGAASWHPAFFTEEAAQQHMPGSFESEAAWKNKAISVDAPQQLPMPSTAPHFAEQATELPYTASGFAACYPEGVPAQMQMDSMSPPVIQNMVDDVASGGKLRRRRGQEC